MYSPRAQSREVYSGVSVSPGYAGHVEGIRPTPPCEPLWRLLGGANVVDAPRGAMR